MLQEYVMVSLDIFHKTMQNKPIEIREEAWLTFLTSEEPERIIELITRYPEFKPMYETLYSMCQNVEGVMGFFSEELRIMDRNLVKYMVEEQQKEIEENQKIIENNKKEIEGQKKEIEGQKKEIEGQKKEIEEKNVLLEERDSKIEMLTKQIEELKQKLGAKEGVL